MHLIIDDPDTLAKIRAIASYFGISPEKAVAHAVAETHKDVMFALDEDLGGAAVRSAGKVPGRR